MRKHTIAAAFTEAIASAPIFRVQDNTPQRRVLACLTQLGVKLRPAHKKAILRMSTAQLDVVRLAWQADRD